MRTLIHSALVLAISLCFTACNFEPGALVGAEAGKDSSDYYGNYYIGSDGYVSEYCLHYTMNQIYDHPDLTCDNPGYITDTITDVREVFMDKMQITIRSKRSEQPFKIESRGGVRFRSTKSLQEADGECSDITKPGDPSDIRVYECKVLGSFGDFNDYVLKSIQVKNPKCSASVNYVATKPMSCMDPHPNQRIEVWIGNQKSPELSAR